MQIIYSKPKWIPIIYDKNQEVKGKILLSYCMIKKEDAEHVENGSIFPKGEFKPMTIFNIGVRNIKMVWADLGFPNFCQVEVKTSSPHRKVEEDVQEEDDETKEKKQTEFDKKTGLSLDVAEKIGEQAKIASIDVLKKKDPNDMGKTLSNSEFSKLAPEAREQMLLAEEAQHGLLKSDKLQVIEHGVTFDNKTEKSRVMKIDLRIPSNKTICPILEVFMYHFPMGKKKLFACGTYSLKDTLAWYYGIEDDEEYKARWNKFFKINQKKGEEEKDKPVKIKVPKVKAENQLLFMDDLIYELPTAGNFQSKRAQKQQNREKKALEGNKDTSVALVSPEVAAKNQSMQVEEEVQEESEESFEKYYKVITDKLGEGDLANLTEDEKKNVVAELYKRGYFEDWELNEGEEGKEGHLQAPLQQSNVPGQSQVALKATALGPTTSAYPFGNPNIRQSSNLGESQHEENQKKADKMEDQFNLDLAQKADSEDNKMEVTFINEVRPTS